MTVVTIYGKQPALENPVNEFDVFISCERFPEDCTWY